MKSVSMYYSDYKSLGMHTKLNTVTRMNGSSKDSTASSIEIAAIHRNVGHFGNELFHWNLIL